MTTHETCFRNSLVAFVLLFVFITGCSKNANNLPASLQELTKQTNCTCNPFLDEYAMNGATIYMYSCGGPACDCVTNYYNAKGETFQLATGQPIAFVRHIWSCKD